jgi:hypothetical protein
MLRVRMLALALNALLLAGTAHATAPVVLNSSAIASTLTVNGTSLSGGTPVVTLGSSTLTVTAQSATQLTATLPAGLAAGTYALSVRIGSASNTTTSVVAVGAVGPTGAAGPQGPAGATGAQGPQGVAGATGAQGAQGVQGVAGAAGPAGATGAQGAAGMQGATGAAGAQGPQGDVGPQGPAGPAGTGALQLIDGNGTVVGTLYGAPAAGGIGYALASVNGERLAIPFGFGFVDSNGQIQNEHLGLGGGGYLAFTDSGCAGQPYIVDGWIPGASKPSAIYRYGQQYMLYTPAYSVYSNTITVGSVLKPGAAWDSAPSSPTCEAGAGQHVVGYVADWQGRSVNWTYPFSVR